MAKKKPAADESIKVEPSEPHPLEARVAELGDELALVKSQREDALAEAEKAYSESTANLNLAEELDAKLAKAERALGEAANRERMLQNALASEGAELEQEPAPDPEALPPPENFEEAVAHVRRLHPALAAKVCRRKAVHAFKRLYDEHVAAGGPRV